VCLRYPPYPFLLPLFEGVWFGGSGSSHIQPVVSVVWAVVVGHDEGPGLVAPLGEGQGRGGGLPGTPPHARLLHAPHVR
jgi:hypothetical protein